MQECGVGPTDLAAKLPHGHQVTASAIHHWQTGRSRPHVAIRDLLNQYFNGDLPPEGWLTDEELQTFEKRKRFEANAEKTNELLKERADAASRTA